MKTNKFLIGLSLMAAGLAGFSSCSSDKIGDADDIINPDSPDAGVYMAVTIEMPKANGSRSQTTTGGQSNNGTEVGKDRENKVSEAIIVLAKKSDNGFIAAGTVATNKLTAIASENAYKSIAKIGKTELNNYYTKYTEREINVFVFCNPTSKQKAKFEKAELDDVTWIDETTSVSANASEIATDNQFLMANYETASRLLPATMADWNNYKTEATAFNLSGWNNQGQNNQVDNETNRGAIRVERAAARFDFKDGSTIGENTYDVVKNSTNQTIIQIQLTRMALVNLSNKFYDLKRVSANGLSENSTLLGSETSTNYVVGPYASDYNSFAGMSDTNKNNVNFSTYVNHPFFEQGGRMNFTNWGTGDLISTVINGEKDNYTGTYQDVTYNQDYHIWAYAAENVIPGTNAQMNGISTGVVFKGKMIATKTLLESDDADDKKMAETINNVNNVLTGNPSEDPILYQFNGVLYLTWEQVRKAAIAASVKMDNGVPVYEGEGENKKLIINRSNSLYIAVFGNGGIGTFHWGTETDGKDYTDNLAADETSANSAWNAWNDAKKPNSGDLLANMRKAVTDAGFTIYQSSDDNGVKGYYCYYYYWNRHNDNGLEGVMGPMEFAVVRNNVYKLAVTGIHQLGHPRIPENDPNKPDPGTPDEKDDIYITVTFRVMPWVVRVNNIEF